MHATRHSSASESDGLTALQLKTIHGFKLRGKIRIYKRDQSFLVSLNLL